MSLATAVPTRASTFYTIDADADITDGETLVVAGKTYTVQATLTDSDGNVHRGADHQGTISNLVAAINLSNEGESAVGAGTDYADSMTRNTNVYAVEGTDTLTVYAHVPGTQGNFIPVTVGTSAAEVDNATLEGGTGSMAVFAEELLQYNQINSEVQSHLKILTPADD